MRLLGAFIAWVFLLFIEYMWLLVESSDGYSDENIYVIIAITLVVGATGLNILSRNSVK